MGIVLFGTIITFVWAAYVLSGGAVDITRSGYQDMAPAIFNLACGILIILGGLWIYSRKSW
jgi:hypothetical protein